MKKSHLIPVVFASALCLPSLNAQSSDHILKGVGPRTETDSARSLEENFRNPPATARPWVFWMWLRVRTTREAITADLEAMHDKGIEGAILYDSGVGEEMQGKTKMVLGDKQYLQVPTTDFPNAHFTEVPFPPMPSWEPESRDLVRFAAKEAGRLGIKLVVTIGLGSTSGLIAPEYGNQRLVWSEVQVTGPTAFDQALPAPATAVKPSLTSPRMFVRPDSAVGSNPSGLHEIAVLAVPAGEDFDVHKVIDVSDRLDATGRLHWTVPKGKWQILRFAYEPTGRRNPWGLYTDGMSAEALDKTWEATIGKILSEMSPAEHKGLYGIEDDSWEGGSSTWTKLFAGEFKQRRGYDLLPWLPVLAGRQMGSREESDGVRRDYYRVIADTIARNHYGRLGELAHRNGLQFYSEAAGPNSGQLDPEFNSSEADVPMGEFWTPSPHRPTPDVRFLMRDTASAGHVYGKRVLGCESLTSVGPHWEDTFFELKNVVDQGFTDGCNLNVIHNFSQSPSVTAKPGYVYFAGTHYNRNVTWWDQTPAFNEYLGRTAYMLQQGHFVADALYYRGDAIGQMEQRKTEPALPAPGYDHDNINLDALVHRVSVKNGRLVLPDGMSYRMLVLPENALMAPEALQKINSLVAKGAVIVGPRPLGPDGRIFRSSERQAFNDTVSRLWNNRVGKEIQRKHIYKGSVHSALESMHLPPDFQCSDLSDKGELDYIHRRNADTDIYFIASRWDQTEKVSCTFRVGGREPELWNPVSGEIFKAHAFEQQNGRTILPLEFDPRGSVFVVFRSPIPLSANGDARSNYPSLRLVNRLDGEWRVSFDPKWGGPDSVSFESLVDWTKRPEDNIRHYSGAAVYRKTIRLDTLPKPGERLLLDLGEVHEIASVKVNGNDLGVVWTKPARIDVTKGIHIGSNDLEITIVNLWPNRLIGDESLPVEQRFTQTNVHKFSATTPLFPSGLLGPVKLEIAAPSQ